MNVSIYLAKSKSLLYFGASIFMLSACSGIAFNVPEHLPSAPNLAKNSQPLTGLELPDASESVPLSRRLPVLNITSNSENKPQSKWQDFGLNSSSYDLNVESLPLNDFIQVALGDVLGLSFIIDPAVQAKQDLVTLRISKPMEPVKFLSVIEQLLSGYGVGLSNEGGTLQVLPANKLISLAPTFVNQGMLSDMQQGKVITILPLKYSAPDEAMRFVRHFMQVGATADIQVMRRLNALLLIGESGKIEKFKAVIDMVDRPSMTGRRIELIRAIYWSSDEIIDLLQEALKLQGIAVAETVDSPGVYLREIKQINSLMIAAPDQSVVNWVMDWMSELDTPESVGTSLRSFVYNVRHSTASDIGAVVSQVLGGYQGSSSSNEQVKNDSNAGQSNTRRIPSVTSGSNLRLVVDEQHNSLVFVGSAQAYKTAHQLLEKLDVPAKQVLLEVTVADLTLNNNTQLGVEWEFENSGSDGILDGRGGTLGRLGIGAGGFTYTAFDASSNIRARINTLATKGQAKILSSPRLLAVDNEEARIQVGTQIAVISSENTDDSVNGIVRSFNYIDTGVILSFIPTVMADGVVRLKMSQEVSSPGPSANNTPPINTRSVETTLIAKSGSTIMIGGLISSTDTVNDEQIPLLGDIPILGALFRGREVIDDSTEMVVLITPHVIEAPLQIEALTESFRSSIGW